MSKVSMIRSAVAHLGAALRLLERAGADIPAAHVDAALNSLAEQIRKRKPPFDANQGIDFSALDRLVDEPYDEGKQLGPDHPGADDTGE